MTEQKLTELVANTMALDLAFRAVLETITALDPMLAGEISSQIARSAQALEAKDPRMQAISERAIAYRDHLRDIDAMH